MKFNRNHLLFFICFVLTACSVVFEPDITSKKVNLLAPPDSAVTTISFQTFWWDIVDGANYYKLQVVTPSFINISMLILDTLVYGNKCSYSLLPGKYEWRVCAENFAYSSTFTTHKLIVDSTANISHQTIRLIVPPDLDTTNIMTFLFEWELLYNADNYNFQLYYGQNRVFSQDGESDTIRITLLHGDGPYIWKVRGQNTSSNTPYSSRSIYLDTSPPGKPQLMAPDNHAQLAADSLIWFLWKRQTDNGSSIRDSMQLYKDSLFTNPVINVWCNSPEFSDSLKVGTYYWRVRSFDKAGNKSDYSMIRKLVIR
ncbi:MAG: hypothetical protein PHP04_08685 [Bacteroidales bacterium]|nr:hypothetical protein [Bacteroidales bacterium]